VARFIYRGDPNYAEIIDRRMPSLNHPTVLARRACFERIGLFDLRYRCAMDYDWFLRLHRAGRVGVYNPGIVGHMNHDGTSNNHYRRRFAEVCDIAMARRHGVPAPSRPIRSQRSLPAESSRQGPVRSMTWCAKG
jgi:GT2 family glycosyltransferase